MAPAPAPSGAITLPGLAEVISTTGTLIANSVRSLSAADPGLFGPGSVSWRIFRHPSYSVSGIAAVLVQALHPVAMGVVDQHSAFRHDAWRRAHMTTDYVFTITFSGKASAEAAAARVRNIHRHVVGTDPVTRRAYRADDADLLLWIHCVHTEYALIGHEAYAGDLSAEEQDRFVREQIVAAGLVGLDHNAVPASRAQLRDYVAGVKGLQVTRPALDFCRLLLRARMPLAMRPFWALHIAGAMALLPPQIYGDYGLPRWLPRGRAARGIIGIALHAIDIGFSLFAPVRQARARLREVERAAQEPAP